MIPALQIFSRDFDAKFFKLPVQIQERIESKIDQVGLRLENYPHTKMKGVEAFRIRVGDYRVIYDFDASNGFIRLLTVGHRREVVPHLKTFGCTFPVHLGVNILTQIKWQKK